jgi:hypothetical protein
MNNWLNINKGILSNKFNLVNYNTDFENIAHKKKIKFINNIINPQYGLNIVKYNKYYKMTDKDIWYGIDRDDKIISKKIEFSDDSNKITFE